MFNFIYGIQGYFTYILTYLLLDLLKIRRLVSNYIDCLVGKSVCIKVEFIEKLFLSSKSIN